jgi:hypothetical protein
VFLRVFGDTIEALEEEERRLFYAATTRAAGSLAIVTDGTRASPYLNDIQAHQPLQDVCWDNLRSASAPLGTQLEVRVFKAFEVRDELKRLGFRFDGSTKAWLKVCLPKVRMGTAARRRLASGREGRG